MRGAAQGQGRPLLAERLQGITRSVERVLGSSRAGNRAISCISATELLHQYDACFMCPPPVRVVRFTTIN